MGLLSAIVQFLSAHFESSLVWEMAVSSNTLYAGLTIFVIGTIAGLFQVPGAFIRLGACKALAALVVMSVCSGFGCWALVSASVFALRKQKDRKFVKMSDRFNAMALTNFSYFGYLIIVFRVVALLVLAVFCGQTISDIITLLFAEHPMTAFVCKICVLGYVFHATVVTLLFGKIDEHVPISLGLCGVLATVICALIERYSSSALPVIPIASLSHNEIASDLLTIAVSVLNPIILLRFFDVRSFIDGMVDVQMNTIRDAKEKGSESENEGEDESGDDDHLQLADGQSIKKDNMIDYLQRGWRTVSFLVLYIALATVLGVLAVVSLVVRARFGMPLDNFLFGYDVSVLSRFIQLFSLVATAFSLYIYMDEAGSAFRHLFQHKNSAKPKVLKGTKFVLGFFGLCATAAVVFLSVFLFKTPALVSLIGSVSLIFTGYYVPLLSLLAGYLRQDEDHFIPATPLGYFSMTALALACMALTALCVLQFVPF